MAMCLILQTKTIQRGYILAELIYRVTNTGDTKDNVGVGEKISFNLLTSGVPDNTGRLLYPALYMKRNINFHPNLRKSQNPFQDALLSLTRVTLTGYFLDTSATLGPSIFHNWQIDPGDPDAFPRGNIGLELSKSMGGVSSLVPTLTKGYIIDDFETRQVEDTPEKVFFYINLIRGGDVSPIPIPGA